MTRKIILVADPGIDTAFAAVLALYDPNLDVLGVAATAGNVSAEQATRNVQIVVEHADPPRLPRLGSALPVDYGTDGTRLHGPGGLGGIEFPCAQLHHQHSSDKLLIDLVRQYPGELTVVVLGPLTVVARAFDRDPELPKLLARLVCVGGTWHEPGNASAVAEFHFFCDPLSARQIVRTSLPITIIPLDVTRKALFSPGELMEMTSHDSPACRFLGRIVPYGIGMTSNLYGIEGLHLKDVAGIVAVALPEALTTRSMRIDVETNGDLTRGMMVVDARPTRKNTHNADLAVGVEFTLVRKYIHRILDLTKKRS